MLRYFHGRGKRDFQALLTSGLLDKLVRKGTVIPYRLTDDVRSEASCLLGLDSSDLLIVEHERLPLISYVYEWPFSMLQQAALLHLHVLLAAVDAGFTLKDGTPYNVQFVGTRPVFIDLGSFTPYVEGQPWYGYAQFCRMFLNPLLLYAYTGTPYHAWMRGCLEGIAPAELRRVLSLRHQLRPSVLTNVVLQAMLERDLGGEGPTELVQTARISKRSYMRQIERLRDVVNALRPPRVRTPWTEYQRATHYSEHAREEKVGFVERVLSDWKPALLWDLGSNQGEYTLVASRHAKRVVALDSDPGVVDQLYRRASTTADNVLPLVMDILNPSPSQGWAGIERQSLLDRGRPDTVMALALVHHLCLGGNVPVQLLVDWLAELADAAVVEFVPKEDPMVRRLLAWREDIFSDYDQASFATALQTRFAVRAQCSVPDSSRTLFAATRKRSE